MESRTIVVYRDRSIVVTNTSLMNGSQLCDSGALFCFPRRTAEAGEGDCQEAMCLKPFTAI